MVEPSVSLPFLRCWTFVAILFVQTMGQIASDSLGFRVYGLLDQLPLRFFCPGGNKQGFPCSLNIPLSTETCAASRRHRLKYSLFRPLLSTAESRQSTGKSLSSKAPSRLPGRCRKCLAHQTCLAAEKPHESSLGLSVQVFQFTGITSIQAQHCCHATQA